VIGGNRVTERHFDCVEVVVTLIRRLAVDLLVLAELSSCPHRHALEPLVAASMVQICVPAHTFNPDILDSIFIDARTRRVQGVVVWDAELAVAAVDRGAQPELVGLDQRKDLEVRDRLYVTDDQELLLVFDELSDVLLEKGEWWVRDNDVPPVSAIRRTRRYGSRRLPQGPCVCVGSAPEITSHRRYQSRRLR